MGLLGYAVNRFKTMGGTMNVAGMIGFGGIDYISARSEGKTHAESIGTAIGYGLAYGVFPAVGIGMTLYSLGKGSQALWEKSMDMKRGAGGKLYQANFGHGFKDTQARATMRQRALANMGSARQNAMSILGNEARSIQRNNSY